MLPEYTHVLLPRSLYSSSRRVSTGKFVSNVSAREFNGALSALRSIKTEAERAYAQHVWDANTTNWYYDVFTEPLQDNYGSLIPTSYRDKYKGSSLGVV